MRGQERLNFHPQAAVRVQERLIFDLLFCNPIYATQRAPSRRPRRPRQAEGQQLCPLGQQAPADQQAVASSTGQQRRRRVSGAVDPAGHLAQPCAEQTSKTGVEQKRGKQWSGGGGGGNEREAAEDKLEAVAGKVSEGVPASPPRPSCIARGQVPAGAEGGD